MTDDRRETERLRRAFRTTLKTDSPTADCPPAEQIWDAVHDVLPPRELRQILDHVALCALCTEAWHLAQEVSDPSEVHTQPEVPLPFSLPSRSSFGRAQWTSAAAGVVALVAVFLMLDGRRPGSDGGSTVIASNLRGSDVELELTSPTEGLTRSNCHAAWTPFESSTYDVQVLTTNYQLVHEVEELEEPRVTIPAELLAKFGAEELRILVTVRKDAKIVTRPRTFDLICRAG